MSKFALDTNIVSYYLKGDKNLIAKVTSEAANNNAIVIPPMVYYEIKRWLILNNSTRKLVMFETMYAQSGIKGIDKDQLEAAAQIYADLRKKGITPADNDILIAVFCLQNDLILVTNNEKHFQNIAGLNMVNWV